MENIVLSVELLLQNQVDEYAEDLNKFLDNLVFTLARSGSANIHIGLKSKPIKVTTTIEAAKAIIQSFLLLQDGTAKELSKKKDAKSKLELQEIIVFLGESLNNTIKTIEDTCRVKIPLGDTNKQDENDIGGFISKIANIPKEKAEQLLYEFDSEIDEEEEDDEDDESQDDESEDDDEDGGEEMDED